MPAIKICMALVKTIMGMFGVFPMAWQNFGPAVCHRHSRYVASCRACMLGRTRYAEGAMRGI